MKYYSKKDKYNLKNCTKINDFGIMIGNSHKKLDKFQVKNLSQSFSKINQLIQ